eukprot:1393921-Amorphochlora_amoeboformis.AAC.2
MELWSTGLKYSIEQLNTMAEKVSKTDGKNGSAEDGQVDSKEIKERHVLKLMQEEMKNPIVHELLISQNVICLNPPLQHARLRLGQSLQRLLRIICKLPRIQCWDTRRALEAKAISDREKIDLCTFSSALTHMTTEKMQLGFDEIENVMGETEKYVYTWTQYQALWDMDVDTVDMYVQV